MKAPHPTRAFVAITCLVSVAAIGGCNVTNFLGYAIADAPTKTVKPQFDGLEGKTVAVVIYADRDVQFDYPSARLEMAAVISDELEKKVPRVRVVDPTTILKYQDSNMRWAAMDKTQLAKQFGADYVLYVALAEFTTQEANTLNLYRGRINADVAVYDASRDERSASRWRNTDMKVTYPQGGGPGEPPRDEANIRYRTERLFAEQLVRCFHKHKAPRIQ